MQSRKGAHTQSEKLYLYQLHEIGKKSIKIERVEKKQRNGEMKTDSLLYLLLLSF